MSDQPDDEKPNESSVDATDEAEAHQPHDALFRQTFSVPARAASLLRAMLPPELATRVDWATLALDDTKLEGRWLSRRYTDMLYRLHVDGAKAYVWIVLEHQSSSDRWMPLRLLEYMVLLCRRHLSRSRNASSLPLVVPLVVHHSESGWNAPRRFEELIDPVYRRMSSVEPYIPRFEATVFDLRRESDEQIDKAVDDDGAKLALATLKHAAYRSDLGSWLGGHWLSTMARLIRDDDHIRFIDELIFYLIVVAEADTETIRHVLELGLAENDMQKAMTLAEMAQQRWLREGQAKGRVEGRVEGRIEILERQLKRHFGELPVAIRQRLKSATIAELDEWAERVIDASSLDEVFAA